MNMDQAMRYYTKSSTVVIHHNNSKVIVKITKFKP